MTELREGLARALCALKVSQTSEEWLRYRQDDSWQLFTQEADAAIAYLWPLFAEHAAKLAQNFKGLPNEMLVAAIRAQEPPK